MEGPPARGLTRTWGERERCKPPPPDVTDLGVARSAANPTPPALPPPAVVVARTWYSLTRQPVVGEVGDVGEVRPGDAMAWSSYSRVASMPVREGWRGGWPGGVEGWPTRLLLAHVEEDHAKLGGPWSSRVVLGVDESCLHERACSRVVGSMRAAFASVYALAVVGSAVESAAHHERG